MKVEEWQKLITDNFSSGGITGASILPLLDAERQYGIDSLEYNGHRHLADAFYGFFYDTLRLAEKQHQGVAPDERIGNWMYLCIHYASILKNFRSADILLNSGYPFNGYALFRDLKDRIITIGGLIAGHISVKKFIGFAPSPEQNEISNLTLEKLSKRKKKAKTSVMKRMFGKKSPLSKETKAELEQWEKLFHSEVHGSNLSIATDAMDWLKGVNGLPLFPQYHQLSIAMYMNRFSEVGWLATRTLPYLQLKPNAFGEEWKGKWEVLDTIFKQSVLGLEELEKDIATSFIEFMDRCFNFNSENTFN